MRFAEQLRWKLSGWMQGRYGRDPLFDALYKLALALWVVSLFIPNRFVMSLYLFCVVFATYRCFSRDIPRRRQELVTYERMMAKPRRFFNQQKNRIKDRKTYRYFRCKCGAVLRVPKGKGKVKIHCHRCDAYMIKKT